MISTTTTEVAVAVRANTGTSGMIGLISAILRYGGLKS